MSNPNCRCFPVPVAEGVEVAVIKPALIIVAAKLAQATAKTKQAKEALKGAKDTLFSKPPKGAKQIPKGKIFKRPKGVPKEWIQKPSKNGEGTKYVDPKNSGTYVRIQKAAPKAQYPHQRIDYVRWQKNGRSLDKNGNIVSKRSAEAHIPVKDFKFKPELFQ